MYARDYGTRLIVGGSVRAGQLIRGSTSVNESAAPAGMARRAAPTPLIVVTKPANFALALGLQRITDRREEPVVHRLHLAVRRSRTGAPSLARLRES